MTPWKNLRTTTCMVACLAACAPQPSGLVTGGDAGQIALFESRPADAPPQSCWATLPGAETYKTVERLVEVTPVQTNDAGDMQVPAIFRRVEEKVVTRGPARLFEQVCPKRLTPRFIAAVQRALIARRLLDGPPTEQLDAPTKAAIKTYQKARGLPSDILSLAMARQLGLVTITQASAGSIE
ncbi:MAG: peptidoglycan-binding domain-containing protein [Pseudomonadota bacterium]